MNKKNRIMKISIFVAMVFLLCLIPIKLCPRADINGAESQVIGAACSTFYYNGEYYVADAAYVNQLINALDSQYDLTEAQASICVDYIYNNVGYAIEAGYLVKVEDPNADEDSTSGDTADGDTTDGGLTDEGKEEPDNSQAGTTQQGGNQGSASGQTGYYSEGEIVEIDEDSSKKTKEEAIKEATDFASTMGVIIKYDNGKEGITITDKSGNVLISTREAIKNTGFRLNSIVIFAVLLVLAVSGMIAVAKKFNLLEDRNSYEETEQI
ncbi:MAG: hypothetical protein IJZ96_06915 [Lachnospiraceae bacterium]|nr:hypothetical protein [Lachnospiraceae bacterium]MBQ8166748.1 hypothetical protein [Lachnospiraceae bacterium]